MRSHHSGDALLNFVRKPRVAQILTWCMCLIAASFYWFDHFLRDLPSFFQLRYIYPSSIGPVHFFTLIASFYLAYVPLQLVAGVLVDRYSRRWVLFGACMLAAFGSALFALSSSIPQTSVARFLMGAGTVVAFSGSLKLAALRLPRRNFAMFTAIMLVLGFLGEFTLHTGGVTTNDMVGVWRHQAWLVVAIGFVLAILIVAFVRDTSNWLPKTNYQPVFVVNAIKYMVGLFKQSNMWLLATVAAVLMLPNTLFATLWWMKFLDFKFIHSNLSTVLDYRIVFVGYAFGGPVITWLSSRYKRRKPPILIGAIVVFCMMMIDMYVPDISYWGLIVVHFLLGFFSASHILTLVIAYELNNSRYLGVTMGTLNFLFLVILLVIQGGLLLVQSQFDLGGKLISGAIVPTLDYHITLLFVALVMVFGIVFALFVPETHAESTSQASLLKVLRAS